MGDLHVWFTAFVFAHGAWRPVIADAFDVEHGLYKKRNKPPWLKVTTAFVGKHPCRYPDCKVQSSYYAKDNRAEYGHLCWKHPPEKVGDDPEFYVVIPF